MTNNTAGNCFQVQFDDWRYRTAIVVEIKSSPHPPEYFKLLDWAGRELRANKRGTIPANLAPILQRLSIEEEELLNTLEDFHRLFPRLVGKAEQILERAKEVGRRWMHGVGPAARVFHP